MSLKLFYCLLRISHCSSVIMTVLVMSYCCVLCILPCMWALQLLSVNNLSKPLDQIMIVTDNKNELDLRALFQHSKATRYESHSAWLLSLISIYCRTFHVLQSWLHKTLKLPIPYYVCHPWLSLFVCFTLDAAYPSISDDIFIPITHTVAKFTYLLTSVERHAW